MSKHFNLLEFLRRVPKDLLQLFCARQDILQGFDWGAGNKVAAEQVADALRAQGTDIARGAMANFNGLCDLAGPGFTQGVLNEAKFFSDDVAYKAIQGRKSHLGKAFWVTLERPQYVVNAKILSDIDGLPAGAWIKRGGMPARPGPVDQSVVQALEAKLIEYFSAREYRGANCKIDCLRRGSEEIFFAYAEDHPDTELFWQDGQLVPQVLNPSFQLIFKHDDERRTIEIYIEGDRRLVPDLQQLFSASVIREEVPRESPLNNRIYDIARLTQPGFQFLYAPDLGIAGVRVSLMRFVLQGEPWGRFTVEVDNTKTRDALETLIGNLTAKLSMSRVVLDQVCIKVTFHKREGDRKMQTRDCYITNPNSIRLRKDELGEKIATMLIQSGIERPAAREDGGT